MELRRQLCITGVYVWDLSVEKRCFSKVCTSGIYNSRQIYIQSGLQPAANLAQRPVFSIVLKFVVIYDSPQQTRQRPLTSTAEIADRKIFKSLSSLNYDR